MLQYILGSRRGCGRRRRDLCDSDEFSFSDHRTDFSSDSFSDCDRRHRRECFKFGGEMGQFSGQQREQTTLEGPNDCKLSKGHDKDELEKKIKCAIEAFCCNIRENMGLTGLAHKFLTTTVGSTIDQTKLGALIAGDLATYVSAKIITVLNTPNLPLPALLRQVNGVLCIARNQVFFDVIQFLKNVQFNFTGFSSAANSRPPSPTLESLIRCLKDVQYNVDSMAGAADNH